MKEAREIIAAARRYNGCSDFLKAVYGISSGERFDAIVLAPGWTPEKILAKCGAKITVILEKAGYASYIVDYSGLHLAWIKCGVSSGNLIDAALSLAESPVEPVIFVGAVGALRADIPVGELCTPSESYACDGASLYLHDTIDPANFGRTVRPACRTYIDEVISAAAAKGILIQKRPTFCTDSIICEYAHLDEIKRTGADLIEMETAAFYECLKLMGKKGVALLCVSDNSASGVPLVERTPEQRKRYDECRTTEISEVIKIACEC